MAQAISDAKPIATVSGHANPEGEMDALLLGRTRELAVSSPNERNWRGIFIALLVIIAVLGLIVFSIVLVSPPEEGPRVKGRKPSLEDIFIKLPPPARFNGSWISDTEFVYRDRYGGITLYNAENLTTEVLVTNITFRQYNAIDFKISNDLKYVLLVTDVIVIHEHSRLARYYIYERATSFKRPLSPFELDESAPHLQYATWSPDGRSVVFVYENDIYYKPRIQKDLVCRITMDGDADVRNGVPDWLYETEILHTGHTVWFSPDGMYLLYLTINNSLVGDYKYPWYDSRNPAAKYPKIKNLKYPKVETRNPDVSVWMVNLTTPKFLFPVQLRPTNSVEPGSYLTSAKFYNDHQVSVVWLNRRQNISVVLNCRSQNNYNCTNFHVERAVCETSPELLEGCGWTEPIFHPIFSTNGLRALIRCPVKDGENGDYMHVCQLQSRNVVPLTHGAFEVTRILAWDEENHLIYAIATNEENPGVRHLFKIGDTNSTQAWTCMTCQPKIDLNMTMFEDLTNETLLNDTMFMNYRCDYNNIIFSSNYRYYVHECLGPNVPVVFLVETSTNYRLIVLDAASSLRNKVRNLSMPKIKKFQVDIDERGAYKAQVKLHLPPVLREYEDVAFPLILIIDSKPGTQSVSEKWELSWPWYLASTRNYIVAQIDVRGSGFQGEKMRRQIYNNVGQTEVTDQLAVLTYLRDNFKKFIDREKVCTIGSGYGGYVSAMLMLEDIHEVVNCSVSISPITNWLYYNSYFAERYLGYPSEHFIQYQRADLTKRAGNLDGRRYMLVHGTADTTVNPQHSMMFSKAMIDQGVMFQQLVYPDENHVFSKKSLIHLYKQIDLFFNDSFGPAVEDWQDETDFFIQ